MKNTLTSSFQLSSVSKSHIIIFLTWKFQAKWLKQRKTNKIATSATINHKSECFAIANTPNTQQTTIVQSMTRGSWSEATQIQFFGGAG